MYGISCSFLLILVASAAVAGVLAFLRTRSVWIALGVTVIVFLVELVGVFIYARLKLRPPN